MYTTLETESRHSTVLKNSQFLALAAPVSSVEVALLWLETIKTHYPRAIKLEILNALCFLMQKQ